MAITQLKLYNDALRHIGEGKTTLTESRTMRYTLDDIWDNGRAAKQCLEQAYWKFAKRDQKMEADPDISPLFGYAYGYAQPSDCVDLVSICCDEYFKVPINEFEDQNGIWFCNYNIIYLSYISNDPDYGMDLSRWSEAFSNYVGLYLARRICPKSNMKLLNIIVEQEKMALSNARSKDALKGPTKFFPAGRWNRARHWGRANIRADRIY